MEFDYNYKRRRYFIGAEEYLKLKMDEDDGNEIRINKKVSDLTQAENDAELLYVQRDFEMGVYEDTEKIFFSGVYYSAGDVTFKLTSHDDINWIIMRENKADSLITYPHELSVKKGKFSIANATICQTILDLIFGKISTVMQEERELIDEGYAATTISAVEAIDTTRS